jgi:hypothetical protein
LGPRLNWVEPVIEEPVGAMKVTVRVAVVVTLLFPRIQRVWVVTPFTKFPVRSG